MIRSEFVENVLITFGYIIVFIGIQNYLGSWIAKYPWFFILTGLLIVLYSRSIARRT